MTRRLGGSALQENPHAGPNGQGLKHVNKKRAVHGPASKTNFGANWASIPRRTEWVKG